MVHFLGCALGVTSDYFFRLRAVCGRSNTNIQNIPPMRYLASGRLDVIGAVAAAGEVQLVMCTRSKQRYRKVKNRNTIIV